jgi:hypothetical protein
LRVAAYALAIAWVNAYICRELFWVRDTGHMNSVHGFWEAIARLATHHWWKTSWWPYWDAGMPFEFTYAPLVPWLTSWSGSVQPVIGAVYVLGPVTLFAASAALSGRPGWSFVAALVYSVLSPIQVIVPDEKVFAWSRLGDARRLYVTAVWDEAPHMLALAILPLVVWALHRKRWLVAAPLVALLLLSSAFGLTSVAIALGCLVLSDCRFDWRPFAAAAGGYALVHRFYPLSLFTAIAHNQRFHGAVVHDRGSVVVVAVIAIGLAALWWGFRRYDPGWWIRFVAYFTWVATVTVVFFVKLQYMWLPHAARYKLEAEFGIAVLATFAIAAILNRIPVPVRIIVAGLAIVLASQQVIRHRRFAKAVNQPADPTTTIEYRVAQWTARNLPGARVWAPGSMGIWYNRWSDNPQLTGGSWSTAYNPVHQKLVFQSLYNSDPIDAQNVTLWLKAYGVEAFAIPGRKSPEFWKAVNRPEDFATNEVLWREDDTTIYRVPGAARSLAHAVPKDAIVLHAPEHWRDVTEVRKLAAALDRAVHAEWKWEGTDNAVARIEAPKGWAVTIQVTHHPRWRATANGRDVPIQKDGLGLMWLDAPCEGPCEIRVAYD